MKQRWLAAGPFAILASAALYLRASQDRIPARYPVHWGFDGQPNGWRLRAANSIYGDLPGTAVLCIILSLVAIALPSKTRMISPVLIAGAYAAACASASSALLPLVRLPIWLTLAPAVALILFAIVSHRKLSRP